MVLRSTLGSFYSIREDNIIIFTILFVLVFSINVCRSEDIVYSDKNIIKNGGFEDEEYGAWFTGENVFFKQSAAHNGVAGLDINSDGELNEHYFLQTLMVPSVLNSATLSYDLRVIESNISEPAPLLINIYVGKSVGIKYVYGQMPALNIIGTIHTETFAQSADWKSFSVDIDPGLINEIQTSHEAGEFIFLVFSFSADQTSGGLATNTYPVHLDNVNFAVEGKQQVPAMQGKIIYYGVQETPSEENQEELSYEGTINSIAPETGKIDIIRRSKYLKPDVRWKPDGTEIAFVSTREENFSPFCGDIYTIKSDGTELRKVTSQPSQQQIASGDYPRITLTGDILNNSSTNEIGPTSIHICPLGAQNCAVLLVGAQDTIPFTLPNVAVFDDPTLFDQRANLYWSDNRCLYGIEYEQFTGAVKNNTVDIGTISLEGTVCIGYTSDYRPRELSWKKDGTKIGATFSAAGMLVEFDTVTGLPLYGDEIASAGLLVDDLEWSPIDDQYLFTAFGENNERSIYLVKNGREPEVLLTRGVALTSPAWLLDGSGFIFVGKERSGRPGDILNTPNYVYHYDLGSNEIKRLTHTYSESIKDISVSPGSRYIALVRCVGTSKIFDHSNKCGLWIMDRLNPVEMWQIKEDGYIDSPDWSRVDIPENDAPDNPDNDSDTKPDSNPNSPKGGSGGCFIEILW